MSAITEPRSRSDLVTRLLELCRELSVTGREGALADALEADYAEEPHQRVGNSLVVGEPDGTRPLVLLVGHLDVVPPTEADTQPRLEEGPDGEVIVGRGSSDMKGGVAVAEALFADGDLRASSPFDLALVLYAGEEGPANGNELGAIIEAVPWLVDAALAVVLEPSDLEVQLGCMGTMHAHLTFLGRQGHSARPWQGENALTKAGELLSELHRMVPVPVDVEGLRFQEVMSATQAWTDTAPNVIPGRFTVNVNYRFAPSRTVEEAEAELQAWVGDRAQVQVVDRAPAASPRRDNPLVAGFIEQVAAKVTPKQAWTDVARLSAAGIPALNYGPGVVAQAHQSGEYIPVSNMRAAFDALQRFLRG